MENVDEAFKKADGLFEEVKSYAKTLFEGRSKKEVPGSFTHHKEIKDHEKSRWDRREEEDKWNGLMSLER